MVRIDKVYTRGGDKGETSLGTGARVPKDSLRIEAYGTVDELNATLGMVLVSDVHPELAKELGELQQQLFDLGADLCMGEPTERPASVTEKHVQSLERLMDRLSEDLPPLTSFILPGGTKASAALHVSRTVCRRAERVAIALSRVERVHDASIMYLNRLSDALFVMGRFENRAKGEGDVLWTPGRHSDPE